MNKLPRRSFIRATLVGSLFASFAGAVNSMTMLDRVSNRPRLRPTASLETSVDPGKLICVGFDGSRENHPGVRRVHSAIQEGYCGAIMLLARNIEDSSQLSDLCGYLNEARTSKDLLISIDNEGGRVLRTKNKQGFLDWHSAAAITASGMNSDQRRAYYRERATQLKSVGVNWNFAPVIDLNVNPQNPIIGQIGRSYSLDPAVVAEIAEDVIMSHRDAGVMTALKHFPGHGSTSSDSHFELPDISQSWSELELLPYWDLHHKGLLDAIMTAHVFHPLFSDQEQFPASLSSRCYKFIRNTLRFNGVILTDDLQMRAISKTLSPGRASVTALKAGADIALFSNFLNPDHDIAFRIYEEISSALEWGELEAKRVSEANNRVDELRTKYA